KVFYFLILLCLLNGITATGNYPALKETQPVISIAVRILSFSCSYLNKKTMLSWTVDNVNDFDKFEIERSINGTDFTTVGIALRNEDTNRNNYEFPDDLTKVKGTAFYYRLKVEDKHGALEYSKIVLVKI
ncbi:MAG: hypothetical protein M3O67_10250, partial [Bacteroidota bacterium]|nr:hypothetical protein [Bacteroidota bacterium]